MTEEIEPLVPVMPRELQTDGGTPIPRPRGRAAKTYDDPEFDAPLVPDLG